MVNGKQAIKLEDLSNIWWQLKRIYKERTQHPNDEMASANPTVTVTGTRTMKLPTFSGGSDKDDLPPRDFVERIEAYCKALKKDTTDECTEMQLALRGNATIWWRSLARRGITNGVWTDVKNEFLSTYQPSVSGKTAHAIGQLEQKGTKTINDYFNRLDQVVDEMMLAGTPPTASTKTTYDAVKIGRAHV